MAYFNFWFQTLGDVFKKLYLTNIADLLTSIIIMVVVYIVKAINDKIKLRVPIPIEIIMVGITWETTFQHFLEFKRDFAIPNVYCTVFLRPLLLVDALTDLSLKKDLMWLWLEKWLMGKGALYLLEENP